MRLWGAGAAGAGAAAPGAGRIGRSRTVPAMRGGGGGKGCRGPIGADSPGRGLGGRGRAGIEIFRFTGPGVSGWLAGAQVADESLHRSLMAAEEA